MKKYIIFILMVILSASVYAACYDDDDGLNYKQKGFCKDTEETEGTDFCSRDGLVEYYCHLSLCKAQLKICSDCQDGVCLSKEAEEVIEVNRPPEVDLFVMTTPGKTKAVFKANVYDLDKEMVVFTIDFGDGERASNQADVIHDYKTNGTFNVVITARDTSNGITTFSKQVSIEPQRMIRSPEDLLPDAEKTTKKGFFTKIIDFFKNLFRRG